ncbi:hypothetical protein Alches_16160 [Alicyclobacillus hesperidum subsp. aegles]|nr:hypothetical protein [Alicyclobacillus hesperidum]GLG01576.1 hypothetical protein Alches_16160 [Alicyclobacillus hesperidum subsp. aegles]
MESKPKETPKVYCPICGFEMTEQRGCTPWCRNCGYKGVCGDPTS